MIDLAAIAAARTAAAPADAAARALADQLVAAKADRRQLRADIVLLTARQAALQQALAAAQARVPVATQARDALAPSATTAEAAAADADAESAAAAGTVQDAQDALADLMAEAGPGHHPTGPQIAAMRKRIQTLSAAATAAARKAASARQAADAANGRLAAAQADLDAAQSAVATLTSQLADVTTALTTATARRPAVEALPDQLSAQIAEQRVRVAQAWAPWDALLAAAHAEIAASEPARADLLAGDSPDDLLALVATDAPLALLPVRLETRFDASGLLVRIYPDTAHADAHEPELTDDELAWGRQFLEHETSGDADATLAAWRALTERFGPQRAAWIARAAADPAPPRRDGPWTRAPRTTALPDRWIALGYRDGERRFAVLGAPIADTVVVGPDPGELAATDPAQPLGAAARWMVDFETAIEQGMALRIALEPADAAGLDRLLVLGVHATGDGTDGAGRLATLLDAHHYTDGLALVAPGAPTNNTDSARSAWARDGDDAALTLATERSDAAVPPGSDGAALLRALGLAPDPLAHAGGAAATTCDDARQMRTALWPATWGYMLGALAADLDGDAVDAVRAHVIGRVAAAGPLPTLRLGRQPYGVLPITSLERLRLLDPDGITAEVPPLLRALAPAWRAAASGVPRIAAGAPLDDALAAALAMSPVSLTYGARGLALPAPDAATFDRRQRALMAIRAIGLPFEPALADAIFDPAATSLTGPLVADTLSEQAPLDPAANPIAWLADADVATARTGTPPGGGNTLLFALLRHALLRAYADAALRIVRAQGVASPGEGAEPGLSDGDPPTPWNRLDAPLPGVTTGAETLGAHLDAVRASGDASGSPAAGQLGPLVELQAALRHLSGLPSAELGRLAAGALDLASHRLDAWVTAHATRRLDDLRASRPAGIRLGGYGVLDDVRPAPGTPATHGYVHAPSLGQAATAAVLRAGHVAHGGAVDSPLQIDLSSRRVRLALDLLDGIRAGQPLGALLGYRFERGLHERGPGLALDRFVAPLRALAPLDDLTAAEHDLADALARQKQIEDTIGALTQQLDALRAADQQAKADLRGRLAAAQAALAAARTTAVTMSGKLQSAQRATPAAASDVSVAALPAALAARIDDVQTQIDAVDDANAQVFDADALVGELSAQLLVEAPTIASLEQAISQLQPELDAARAAVAAAQARRDELAAQRPPVSEALRASNVVDGLALRRRWRAGRDAGRWEADTIPYGAAGLPALASPEGQAIDAELAGLDDAVDAVGDLLMAESVHQLVHGNPLRAGATVDALSRGDAPPPDVEVVRTPRSGTGVSHRLLVLLDPGATADGWPTDTTQVRAVVEPGLEAWTASVLGPAARVRVRARYLGASGETPAEVGLDVLRLSALDAVAMAPAGAGADAGEIEAALLDHLSTERPPGVAADAAVELDRTRDPAWPGEQLSLGEFLELARSVRELLDGARALDGRDLARPGDAADPALDAQDLAARAKLAADALHTARTELASAIADGTAARLGPALVRATRLGIAGTTGAVRGPSDGLARAAAAALAELNARDAARDAADGDIAQVAAVLGDGFRMVPLVAAAGVRDLGASLAASDTLQAGDGLAAVTWLQRAAHVRDGAARLERALLCAEAVGSPERLRLRVGQLPHTADDRWVGLPAAPDQPIAGGRLSLVVQGGPAAMAGAERIAGLVVDEWTEVVPDATQMTGIGFHVDQPDSRAPQAILLAVAPTEDHVWSLDALEATVLETLELARLRLIDLEALGAPALTTPPPPLPLPGAIRPRVVPRLGQYLPAVYLAAAPDDVTVTTDLGRVTAPPS